MKYKIKHQLKIMPGTFRQNVFKLCLHCDISQSTLYRWMHLKIGESYSIPTDQFYQIADFFGCNPEDLRNG